MEERDRSSSHALGNTAASTGLGRRAWLKATIGGGAGLALHGLLDVPAVQAASRELELSNVSEFTGVMGARSPAQPHRSPT